VRAEYRGVRRTRRCHFPRSPSTPYPTFVTRVSWHHATSLACASPTRPTQHLQVFKIRLHVQTYTPELSLLRLPKHITSQRAHPTPPILKHGQTAIMSQAYEREQYDSFPYTRFSHASRVLAYTHQTKQFAPRRTRLQSLRATRRDNRHLRQCARPARYRFDCE
jgi:hypothetical protein